MSLPIPNVADLSDDQRAKANARTTAMLREFDAIRRSLELPVEHLPIVIETYSKVVVALVAETEREEFAKRTKRVPITLRSEDRDCQPRKIKRGDAVPVIVRPQYVAFRPEDFAIHGDRASWIIHDIKVGNNSQFGGKRGPAPGTEFGPGGICEHLRLETVQTAMDFVLVVEYVGPDPDGEVFEATVVGTAVA